MSEIRGIKIDIDIDSKIFNGSKQIIRTWHW